MPSETAAMSRNVRPETMLVAGRLAGVAAAFLIPVALTRVFDPTAFGGYKQLFLIYGMLFGVAQVGLAESLFYFIPSDPERGGRYAANALVLLLLVGGVAVAAIAAGRAPLAAAFGNPALAPCLPLLGVHLALMLASAGLEIALTSRRRFARAATLYAASDLARVALFVLPATLARGLTGLLWGAVALGAVRLVAAVVFLRAEFGPEFRTDASLLRRQLAYALPFEAAVVGEVLQANWHQVAVAHRVDAATFAIYAVGCLQVPLVDLVAGATGNVMMVTMAREVATGRLDLALRTWHDAVRKLACLFFPFVALLIACAPDLIVALFTERYRASAPIFMIWCGAFLLAALPTDAALRVFADTRGMVAIGTFKLILVVASVGAMVQRFGLDGAVVTALAAITCGKVAALGRLRTWFGRRHADLLPWGDLGGAALTAGAALLPALVVGREVALAPPARMVVIVLVYAAAYAALGGLRRLRAPGAPFGPLAEEGPVAGR